MDLKSTLVGYFEETSIPSELAPDNIVSALQPRTSPKKTVETRNVPEVKAPVPQPVSAPAPAPEEEALSLPAAEPEPEKPAIGASAFIKIVRHNHLTGNEFLGLLGNSKISNKAYQEIENNPDLTVKRLIEILDESPLTTADYEKLIVAVQRTAKLKEETRAKLDAAKSDPMPIAAPVPKPVPISETAAISAPVPTPVPVLTEEVEDIPAPAPKPIVPEPYGRKKAPWEETKSEGPVTPKLLDEEDGDDDEFDEDNEDEYGGEYLDKDGEEWDEEDDEPKKKGSNRNKFIISAVAGLLLIALSFGLRWYFTGSLLPYSDVQAIELGLDESGIFEALSGLPAAAPAHGENRSYNAGGLTEESPLLSSVMMNNRLIYYSDNTLYIFEKIGGQLDQLDVRKYDEGIEILGLLKLNSGAAVVTSYEGDEYSFSYVIPAESEEESDTSVTAMVRRPETVIELLDGDNPENRSGIRLFGFSGSLAGLWIEGDRIIAVTSESLQENAAAQDAYSFMPYVYTPYVDAAENRLLCSAENVLVPEKIKFGSFVTVFSLDTAQGTVSSAAVAGGSEQLVSRSGNDLFIGQGELLVRYDISGDIAANGYCGLPGTVGDFSAVGVYGEEIRITVAEEDSALLTVLDSELNTLSEVKNLGNGEVPVATCYNKNETYLVTEAGTLYGIDGENEPMTASTANITDADIYRWSSDIGIRIDPLGDESLRSGVSVTAVSLDGSLSVLSTLEISSRTVAEQALDEYLSSPAETDISVLGASRADGVLVVPVVYFDGVSEVERFVICTLTEQGFLSFGGSVCEYDRHSSLIFAAAESGVVIAVSGDRLVTARMEDAGIIGYFSTKPAAGAYSYYG